VSIASEKAGLRTRYRFERRERFMKHSFSHLADSDIFANTSHIASYISYGDEPSTYELNIALLNNGKNLYLPRINDDQLEWGQWDGDNSDLTPSKFSKKLLEPTGPMLNDLTIIQAVIVPSLRIDGSGYRLGQGGGFYDRALAELQVWSIGLIHPHEISSEDLPREDFDIPLKAAATPNLLMRFNS
jgi:5-formyltetrahydrofolate cyclo-ligase